MSCRFRPVSNALVFEVSGGDIDGGYSARVRILREVVHDVDIVREVSVKISLKKDFRPVVVSATLSRARNGEGTIKLKLPYADLSARRSAETDFVFVGDQVAADFAAYVEAAAQDLIDRQYIDFRTFHAVEDIVDRLKLISFV